MKWWAELADREGRCEFNDVGAAASSCRAAGVAIETPMAGSKLSATCFVGGRVLSDVTGLNQARRADKRPDC